MGKQVVAVSMFYNGVWNVVDTDTFTKEQIRILRGQGAESAALRPASVALSLNNDQDKYRPTNPTSPLYGKAGRNTLIEVDVAGDVRGIFEISSFAPDRSLVTPSTTRGRAVVDIEAQGLLRRIASWSDLVVSDLTWYFTTYLPANGVTVTGVWPLEDAPGTTNIYVPVAGSSMFRQEGITFGGQVKAPGTASAATVANGGWVAGNTVPSSNVTGGWQVFWVTRLPAQPTGATNVNLMGGFLDNGDVWNVTMSGTNLQVFVGATVTFNVAAGGTDWTKPHPVLLQSSISGGTVTISLWWYTPVTGWLGTTTTYADTRTGNITYWSTAIFGTEADGMTLGEVVVTIGTAGILTGNWEVVYLGHPGESAADRFNRLCSQQGVTGTVLGSTDTELMGPTLTGATFLEHLQEIAATEDAQIYDDRANLGLIMWPRNARSGAAVTMALNFPADIAPPIRESIDDQGLHNIVTLSQRDGGELTVSEATGPLSTQDAPNGVGEYRQRIDVNVASEATQLPALAAWYLNRGTVEGSRFSSITVDLVARPALVATAPLVDIGDRITLTGLIENPLDLLVIGTSEVIGSHSRKITFTVIPFTPWDSMKYSETTRRADVTASTLNASMTSTAGSVVVKAADANSTWSTTAVPYPWLVAGEKVTVTAITAPSGTAPNILQTATLTRSANGIVKAHSAGEPVHYGTPGRYAP